jgi:ankyrin repeat protein
MFKQLPDRPNLEHLKNQAKKFLTEWKSRRPEALQRAKHYNFAEDKKPALNLAQLIIAREYGFISWAKLKAFVEANSVSREDAAKRLVNMMRADVPAAAKRRTIENLLTLYGDLDSFDLGLACTLGNVEYVQSELSRNPKIVNERSGFGNCEPLLYCTFSWFLKHDEIRRRRIRQVVELLLASGADPNAGLETGDGRLSALYGAAGAANDLETVRMLLEAGANPNDGESCYHAVEHPGHEILELLFAKNVDETQKSHAIFRKLDFDDLETVGWLLDHGVSPDQRWHADGSTPLMHALNRNRSIEFFRLLLGKGADPNLSDNAGQTPYRLATTLGRTDVAELLSTHGANPELGTFETWVADILDGKKPTDNPDFSQLGRSQRDLLCQLAGNGQTAEVAALLDAGFPIELGLWSTPLHAACWNGQVATVRLLISRGAPVEATDPIYHSTPIGWTMHGSINRKGSAPENYAAIFESLITAGARMPSREEGYWQEPGSASPEIQEWLFARV